MRKAIVKKRRRISKMPIRSTFRSERLCKRGGVGVIAYIVIIDRYLNVEVARMIERATLNPNTDFSFDGDHDDKCVSLKKLLQMNRLCDGSEYF